MRIALFSLLGLSFFLFSCEKPEGEGGSSTIQGKAKKNIVYLTTGDTTELIDAADAEIFISYGADNSSVSDRIRTGPWGDYRFENLTPGTYSVFVYSYCAGCTGKEMVISEEVVIADKKSTITVPDFEFFELKE